MKLHCNKFELLYSKAAPLLEPSQPIALKRRDVLTCHQPWKGRSELRWFSWPSAPGRRPSSWSWSFRREREPVAKQNATNYWALKLSRTKMAKRLVVCLVKSFNLSTFGGIPWILSLSNLEHIDYDYLVRGQQASIQLGQSILKWFLAYASQRFFRLGRI